eukprot:4946676-Pleurochrysis_carterae.AAC.1
MRAYVPSPAAPAAQPRARRAPAVLRSASHMAPWRVSLRNSRVSVRVWCEALCAGSAGSRVSFMRACPRVRRVSVTRARCSLLGPRGVGVPPARRARAPVGTRAPRARRA